MRKLRQSSLRRRRSIRSNVTTATQRPSPTGPGETPDLWQAAVAHLLDKRRFDRRSEPRRRRAADSPGQPWGARHRGPGRMKARARRGVRFPTCAARCWHLVFTGREEAAETLRRLLLTAPAREIERDLRSFSPLLHSDDRAAGRAGPGRAGPTARSGPGNSCACRSADRSPCPGLACRTRSCRRRPVGTGRPPAPQRRLDAQRAPSAAGRARRGAETVGRARDA